MVLRRLTRVAHRSCVEHPVAVVELDELDARVHRRRAVFVGHDVLASPCHDRRPGPGQDAQRDLVRHHPRRHEQRRRLADACGEGLFEGTHGGILAVVVVPDLGVRHGASHGVGRARHGVAAQVHHVAVGHGGRLTAPRYAAAMTSPPSPTGSGAFTMPGGQRGINDLLDVEVLEAGPERVVMRLPVDWRVHQPFGILHGGVSALLAESAASLGAALAAGPERSVVGIELSASHLRGLRDGHLTAEATPVRVGRTVQVWRIVLTDDDGRAICESRCSLAVLDGPGGGSAAVQKPAPTE